MPQRAKTPAPFVIVLVTTPNLKVARKLAKAALKAHAAACANLVSNIESHYWWKGKIESATEILVIFKTTQKLLGKLDKVVIANHPYDTPEFVALTLAGGNKRYLQWLAESVSPRRRTAP